MNATHYKAYCYAGYSWRVFANNRFAGYVIALSERDAMKKANEKYGSYVWIERMRDKT